MPILFRAPVSNKPQLGDISKIIGKGNGKYLFATKYSDGVEVAVSRPLLDRLAFILPLTEEFIDEKFETPTDHDDWVKLFMQGLYNNDASDKGKSKLKASVFVRVLLKLGTNASTVFCELYGPLGLKKQGAHRLRVELNLNQLGTTGGKQFVEAIAEASANQIILPKALSAAHLTKVDVAVDLAGVDSADIHVRSDVGKLVHYKSKVGSLETEYGGKSATIAESPLFGDVQYRLYDKRKELLSKGAQPDFKNADLTRFERVLTWKKGPPLSSIANLDLKMSGYAISYLPDAGGEISRSVWRDFVYLRRLAGPDVTRKVLGHDSKMSAALEKQFQLAPFNAFDLAGWWSQWQDSIKKDGIKYFHAS